jgi:hypothetical protein
MKINPQLRITITSLLIAIPFAMSYSCSDTQFASSTQKQEPKTQEFNQPPVEKFPQSQNQLPQQPIRQPQEQSSEPPASKDEVQKTCWFAVSGAWMGVTDGNWPGIFPAVKGGGDIKHGARFDDFGGVFLEARDTPYVNKDQGGEINKAVTWTFDSIAVAPGMQVEIRDETGKMIYEGEGPMVGQSSYHAGADVSYRSKLLTNKNIPEWMREVAENDQIQTLDLHSKLFGVAPGDAQSVLVKKVPGSNCDVSF